MADTPGSSGPPTDPGAPAAEAFRGAVLRAWRKAGGLTQLQLATSAYVDVKTLSDWERGDLRAEERRVYEPLQQIRSMDTTLGADGALEAQWQAVGSPDALPARSDWMHNYRIQGRPGWLWIRSRSDCTADISWGPLEGRVSVAGGAGGLLVQLPVTVDNPPLRVSTTAPVWVDFGPAVVPERIAAELDIAWVLGQDLQEPRQSSARRLPVAAVFDQDVDEVRGWVRTLRLRWDLIWPHIGTVLSTHTPEQALDGRDVHPTASAGEVRLDHEGRLMTQLTLDRHQVRTLRRARGHSHGTAAAAVNLLDPGLPPVSRLALERNERSGALPRADGWLSRLDVVYRADGRLGVERTFDPHSSTPVMRRSGTRAAFAVTFPEYWVGPVWLQVSSGGGRVDRGSVRLSWGPWLRRQRVRSGQVLTTRKARTDAVPLDVEVPAGWHVVAGTGAVGTALDINDDWQPRTLRAGLALVKETLATIGAHREIARALSERRRVDEL